LGTQYAIFRKRYTREAVNGDRRLGRQAAWSVNEMGDALKLAMADADGC